MKEVTAMNSIEKLIYPGKSSRHIFFSGKGGVGKTSMACIIAVKTASAGYRTLLLTTDPAAHIGNVLEKPVTDEASAILEIPNLYAAKIDQKRATEEYKHHILEDARKKFNSETVMAMEEELNSPCTEEMAAFQKFVAFASEDEYEVIVFDTAPTGHTLRLLELPMDWSRQLELKAGVATEISEEDKRQKERFDRVIDRMKDPEISTFAFVMYPEKTPIVEAHRASEELGTLGIRTHLAVANLVIPEEQAATPFFMKRRAMQLKYIDEIRDRFKDAELVTVPMYETEIKGLEVLKRAANEIFG